MVETPDEFNEFISPLKKIRNHNIMNILEKYRDYVYLSGSSMYIEYFQINKIYSDFDFFFVDSSIKPDAEEKYNEMIQEIKMNKQLHYGFYESKLSNTFHIRNVFKDFQFIKPNKNFGMNHFDNYNTRFFSTYPFKKVKKHKSIKNIPNEKLEKYFLFCKEIESIHDIKRIVKYSEKDIKNIFYSGSDDPISKNSIEIIIMNHFLDFFMEFNNTINSDKELFETFFNYQYDTIFKNILNQRNYIFQADWFKNPDREINKKFKKRIINEFPEYFI